MDDNILFIISVSCNHDVYHFKFKLFKANPVHADYERFLSFICWKKGGKNIQKVIQHPAISVLYCNCCVGFPICNRIKTLLL